MRRMGGAIIRITDPDNLRLAFYKAARGNARSSEVTVFRKGLDKNLIDMRERILDGTIQMGPYRRFVIFEPKERIILAAPFKDRVLQHAIMNICGPRFESHLINETYACRIGKGSHAALYKASQFSNRFRHYLKLDYRKYFDSISHSILFRQLERLFKDQQLLLLLKRIIDSHEVTPSRGLPIGNLTSQYFANHYLSVVDHFVKQDLRARAYVRYMDDMLLWHDDRASLKSWGQSLADFGTVQLGISLKPHQLGLTAAGIPFLGYRVHPGHRTLSQSTKRRIRRKSKIYHRRLDEGYWCQAEFQAHILPLLAQTRHARSVGFRRRIFMV